MTIKNNLRVRREVLNLILEKMSEDLNIPVKRLMSLEKETAGDNKIESESKIEGKKD